PFGIVDLSLAPTPAVGDSVARILEEMGLEVCGTHGTTAALALRSRPTVRCWRATAPAEILPAGSRFPGMPHRWFGGECQWKRLYSGCRQIPPPQRARAAGP
ncbi:DUF711 family protein, partial [Intestinimonas massiliensis]